MTDVAELCPLCHGTGWMINTTDDPYVEARPEAERCPACNGEKAPAPAGRKEGENPAGAGCNRG